ncbi:MAG: CDP-alcohol phosphatidyltransferase family protein, partial [Myxococcota bacterium]
MSFLLPNLFTLSGVFCGFYAIVLSADLTPQGAVMAALSIFAAGIFDLIDGRIARLTGTQSEFGQQL